MMQNATEANRPHPNDQLRHLVVDFPEVAYMPKNNNRTLLRNEAPTTTINCFQLDEERESRSEQPYNEELNMAKASITGKSYLQALFVECQRYTPRADVAQACMLRVFANHNCFSRCLIGFSPTDPEEETRAFDTVFYGPPNALIARGIFLATRSLILLCGKEVER